MPNDKNIYDDIRITDKPNLDSSIIAASAKAVKSAYDIAQNSISDVIVNGDMLKFIKNDTTSIEITTQDTNTTYTASNGIKLTGTNFTNTGVISFNGSTGAVTYSAPVTSVNGQIGAVTVNVPVTSVNGQTGAITISGGMPNYNAGVAKSLNTTYTAEQDGFILYEPKTPDDTTSALYINDVSYTFNYGCSSTARGKKGGLHQFSIPKGVTYRAERYGNLTFYPSL